MATARVRDLRVGHAIEYQRSTDRTWVAPYRGRVLTVLIRDGAAALVTLEPLHPTELRALPGSNFRAQAYLDPDTEVTVLDLPGVTAKPAARIAVRHPRVPIRRTPDGVLAECRHCDWTLAGHFPAEIEQAVVHHRGQHATGALAVTHA